MALIYYFPPLLVSAWFCYHTVKWEKCFFYDTCTSLLSYKLLKWVFSFNLCGPCRLDTSLIFATETVMKYLLRFVQLNRPITSSEHHQMPKCGISKKEYIRGTFSFDTSLNKNRRAYTLKGVENTKLYLLLQSH